MRDIDFLPAQYRHRHARRQSQPWQIVVVVVIAVMLFAGAMSQRDRRIRAEAELDAIGPQYAMAIAQNKRLAETQVQLATESHSAELYAYLRHPWPSTQLLAALLAPLPEGLALEELTIGREASSSRTLSERSSRSEADDSKDKEVDKLPPAARDLLQLREETDRATMVVSLRGTTTDSSEVMLYLGELEGTDLFESAELDTSYAIENDPNGKQRFLANLVVKPGYGQPGGPTGDAVKTARRLAPAMD